MFPPHPYPNRERAAGTVALRGGKRLALEGSVNFSSWGVFDESDW